ncbi:MAG: tRNA pseudouridine(55) synthase TruB [Ammonifex sp.]|nr:MAG: tRNA pseudouridine(55) synthase TruB [Ammonifex sp.]
MEGILNVLKPPGMTSHDVVDWVRGLTGVKKVGHTGTLDPGAGGVLVVLVGRVTRAAQFFVTEEKEYLAEAVFGAETDTQDAFGRIVVRGEASHLTPEDVAGILPRFRGEITQVPPLVSAVHHGGKRLYDLARAGQAVEVPPRTVEIRSLEMIRGEWGTKAPRVLFRVCCSKGTYVRALITDIGKALGCPAHLGFLLRTRAGGFTITSSSTLEEFAALKAEGNLERACVNIGDALAHLPAVEVKDSAIKAVRSGSRVYPAGVAGEIEELNPGVFVRLVAGADFLAVARVDCPENGRTILKPVWVHSVQV